MSIFAPHSSVYQPSYSGLFRLIDDFNNYAVQSNNDNSDLAAKKRGRSGITSDIVSWTPKFDLQETPSAYILHGEFPGMDKKNINIEFTDDQTVTIRGRSERSHTHEESVNNNNNNTNNNNNNNNNTNNNNNNTNNNNNNNNNTNNNTNINEDEDDTVVVSPTSDKKNGKEVTKTSGDQDKQVDNKSGGQHRVKYWISERSFGEFSRSFNFPARIDASGVAAKLDSGVLNIIVPKMTKPQGRKVAIQ